MIRVLSAAILIALLAVTIWALPWWGTLALAALAAAIAGGELAGLAAHAGAPVSPSFLAIAAAAASVVVVLPVRPELTVFADALTALLLGTVIAGGLLALSSGPPAPSIITKAGVAALAPLYIGLPLGAIAWTQATFGPAAVTWLISVVAVSDTAQFYTGRLAGRHKLAPIVSPAKTVEGAVGGLIAGAVAGAILGRWGLPHVAPMACALVAVLLAAFGICGDLFESLLKRSAGVKDSAVLIPGHGGVLDRLDSYLFAGPVFYLFLRFVA